MALIVAYPFETYSLNEAKVLFLMAAVTWPGGFVVGWLVGLIALRTRRA